MRNFATLTAITALLIGASAAPAFADGHDDKMKHKAMLKSKANVGFETVDADGDMRLDFTEFSNHFEKHHGWSAADSAIEFTRLADGSGTVSKDAFLNIKMDKKPARMESMETTTTTTTVETRTVAGTSEPVMRESRTTTRTTQFGTGTMLGLGTMINYGSFTDYDANNDGMVSFREYSRVRSNAGVTATQSAQEFIRLSDGQSTFSQAQFNSATSLNVLGN